MKKFSYVFAILFLVFNCSSEENDPDNLDPGPFSVTILETRMDGANIEWTEAIDIDDDPITYSIYLEDQLISTGGTALSYNFTGLEPETSYDGYIIADDGRGGTSQDDFFFATEPETIILTINASNWLHDSFPEGEGTREVHSVGFQVPIYENAISYQLEIITFSIVNYDGSIYTTSGGTYTWTNETQSDPVYLIDNMTEYGVYLGSASINTINPSYGETIDYVTSRSGEAQVIITFGSN
ncbi:hypothetical protein [Winogradskyella forsetii]|uniref:hypothetical protein n=1 Tax=Winogradskyella forsetii TaxID=2686077 RepID=UPI0015C099DC|nr:hypothetical protein [Winogradskyella forsetii]